MNLAFVWGAGAVAAGWIILRLIGGEREQKIREWEISRPPPPPAVPAPEQKAPATTVPPKRKAA